MDDIFEGSYYDVAVYKLEQAKDERESAKLLLDSGKYKAANNRAYYSCFHSIGAVLALEPIAFKKHKDTLAYFNKKYVHTEVFAKTWGRRIAKLEVIRHKSDYDDFYIASREEALVQIETAEEIMLGIAVYVNNKHESGK